MFFSSITVPLSGTWTTPSCASCSTANWSCAAPAAMRRCPSNSECERRTQLQQISRADWRSARQNRSLAVGAHLKNTDRACPSALRFSSASTSAIWKRSRRTTPSAASSPILKSFTKPNRKSSPLICTRIISRRNSPMNWRAGAGSAAARHGRLEQGHRALPGRWRPAPHRPRPVLHGGK